MTRQARQAGQSRAGGAQTTSESRARRSSVGKFCDQFRPDRDGSMRVYVGRGVSGLPVTASNDEVIAKINELLRALQGGR